MTFKTMLEVITTVIATFGGGALIVLALSKWLGGLWASRILENEEFQHRLEQDLVARRRDVYARLASALRVFLQASVPTSEAEKVKFLQAHDEAFLWASEGVADAVGQFLDLQVHNTRSLGSIPMQDMHQSLRRCLIEMRKDVGFPQTNANYRIISF